MPEPAIAKLFMHGRSQAVRLPKAFRFNGSEVRVRQVGHGVLLEPLEPSVDDYREIFAALARFRNVPFMEDGREQPAIPSGDDLSFDE